MGCGQSSTASPQQQQPAAQQPQQQQQQQAPAPQQQQNQQAPAVTKGDDEDYASDLEQDDDSGVVSGVDSELTLNKAADKLIAARDHQETETEYQDEDESLLEVEVEDQQGKKFMATKPWIGSIFAPSSYDRPSDADAAPNKRLELEYVYGYRSRDCRSNLRWVDKSTCVYNVAAVGVVLNVALNTQTFFRGHKDDIVSLDYHSASGLVATGALGKRPEICVWDVHSGQEKARFSGFHKRGVCSVSISPCGSKVASVGLDNDHSIAVYDISSGRAVYTTKGDTNRSLEIRWDETDKSSNSFTVVGVKHVYFYDVAAGKKRRGLLGRVGKRQANICVAHTSQWAYVGTARGEIYAFEKSSRKLRGVTAAHKSGGCFTLKANGDGQIFSGGKDGVLRAWSLNGKSATQQWEKDITPYDNQGETASVRSVDFLNNLLLVGTLTSGILSIAADGSSCATISKGHYGDLSDSQGYGEVWGCAPHPKSDSRFVTCGDDKTVRIWSLQERRMLSSAKTDAAARRVCYSPAGDVVVVGGLDGSVTLFSVSDSNELKKISSKKDRKEEISEVKFSPDGSFLAVGSHDNFIDIYSVNADYSLKGTCKGHSSYITHLDWSADSKNIQSTCGAYELLFWDIGDNVKQNVRPSNLKDTTWATQTCTLGWSVQGIWPKYADGTDVNIVNRSNSGDVLATGEDSGLVKLFRFPCIGSGLNRMGKLRSRPDAQQAHGHSEHVTNVTFNSDDSYLVSTGGADLAVFQWKVLSN